MFCEFLSIAVKEVTVLKLLPQAITLSRRKWNFLNHGAFHCLAHPVIHEHWIDVYCLNDPEYLSVRYMALMENRTDARFLRELTVKNWFASILSDRGKMLRHRKSDFQIKNIVR